jgi:prefoldin subunit 5
MDTKLQQLLQNLRHIEDTLEKLEGQMMQLLSVREGPGQQPS